MYTNLAINYFIEYSLAKKGISVKNIFIALFEMYPFFEYEIMAATTEEINILESITGVEMPIEYKEFLGLAGKSLGKLKIVHNSIKADFNITTIIDRYKKYTLKERHKLEKANRIEIAHIGYNSITDYPDIFNTIQLNYISGEISDFESYFWYASLQELLFYFGFLSFYCTNKIASFTWSINNPIKTKNLSSIINSIATEIKDLFKDVQSHPYASGAFQYYTLASKGIHLIVQFSSAGSKGEFVNLNLNIFSIKDFTIIDKNQMDSFLHTLKNAKFVKEMGLRYSS